ncbi:MAG: VanZ family protein [Aeromicrobium sp.]|nr:VanZ family protein [Aeromicrobium sp.]
MQRRALIVASAALYAAALAAVGLWPTHVDQHLDVENRPPTSWLVAVFDLTPSQGYHVGEFTANVLLFVPLGALAITLLRRATWVQVVALGAITSATIELAQTIARPERTGSVSDVVANTAGAAIGAAAVGLWRRARPRSAVRH